MKNLTNLIPFSRLVFYIVLFNFIPLILVGYFYTKQKKIWDEVAHKIQTINAFSQQKAGKQAINEAVRKKYRGADHFYLDSQVESLNFLKKERESLENLINTPSFTGNEGAERRYAFLSSEANRLQFTQGSVHSAEGVQEAAEILAHPVEVDAQDLKELLTRIEGNRLGKPQLLITDFKLNKKKHPNENEVFEINLKLLKREFTT